MRLIALLILLVAFSAVPLSTSSYLSSKRDQIESGAYGLCSLCLLGVAVYLNLRWNKRIKSKYRRRMAEYEIAKEKEIHESKIRFFINLVHEIRTPLSVIHLSLEKLSEEKRGESRDSRYLSAIDKNVTYLLEITNQLLDSRKIEDGGLPLNLKSSNISHLISDVHNRFVSPAELNPPTASEHNINNPYSGRKFTVLLVEDNLELLNLTKESLNTFFRVVKAQNGRQALEVLTCESVDVIVSDVMMPEMDGLELTKIVKANIDYSHIPIILLTAKATLESKIEGFECGADVYIEKPYSIRQLRMQIENLLKLRLAFHKLMAELSGSSVGASEVTPPQKDCTFIAKIQEVVGDQLSDENFSIDNLAEMMHMSRSNFYRKIKVLSGMAPNDYLKMLRLNKAAELIKNGIRIAEVCERVGFTSSSYFAKCFKAQFGVLPRDYKG